VPAAVDAPLASAGNHEWFFFIEVPFYVHDANSRRSPFRSRFRIYLCGIDSSKRLDELSGSFSIACSCSVRRCSQIS